MAKRAALFGCNYAGTNNALHGCINDVTAVKEMLLFAYQFPEQVRHALQHASVPARSHVANIMTPTASVSSAEHHCDDRRSGAEAHRRQHQGVLVFRHHC